MDLGIEGIDDVEQIARGGTASVYRARQPRLGRTVAVKVIDSTAGEKVIRRFEREARALGTLSEHPGIVTVYEVGTTTADLPYLLMQYCPGGSLQDVIARGDTMPPARARELIAQVAATLAVAHERGVFHHDLKPANLLLDRQGRAMVADFGIAALTHADNGVTSAILFTPGFAAPESLEGSSPTAESDVYSLGATLYALVTGRVPFTENAAEDGGYAVAIRAMSEDLPDTRPLGVPDDIASVIERATSRVPSERPTMNDIALMLRGGRVAAKASPPKSSPAGPATLPPTAAVPHHAPPTTSLPKPVSPPRAVSLPQAATLPQAGSLPQATEGPSRWVIAAFVAALIGMVVAAGLVYQATRDNGDNTTDDAPTAAETTSTNQLDDPAAVETLVAEQDDQTPASPGVMDPLGLCDSGSTLIHGGESYGVPDSDSDVQVAICLQPSGALEYFGLETATNLSIRLPACALAPGRFVADNSGFVYTVTNDLASSSPSVALVSPAGAQQFEYTFDEVLVGDGAANLTVPSC